MRALALAALLAAAGFAQAQPADPVLARVDGQEIRRSDVEEAVSGLPGELRAMPRETLFPLLLDQLINQKALANAARAQNLQNDPAVRERLRRIEEEVLVQAAVQRLVSADMSDEALAARYRATLAARPVEEEVRARHILVPTEAEARSVLAELRRPGADFAAIARRRSTDPGSRDGGDLGFFKRGDMVPEFAEAAFALRPGETAQQPVRTQFGWHVIRTEERRQVAPPSFDDMREELRRGAFEAAVNAAVARVRAEAKVELLNADGSPAAPAPAPSLLDRAAPPAR